MNRKSWKIFFFLICLIFFLAQEVSAQYYFGKNKVHYAYFDWQLMETLHFDIYFYPEEREIAEMGAAAAEESYIYLEQKFAHTVQRRIPLIFYSSHIYFEQTNTTPGLLPEGVGGFIEFIKGRVVIPHTGSLSEFFRVIRHELVHVFMYDKIRVVLKKYGILNVYAPPLWFSEGLAEYWSGKWDSQTDMIVKDAVLSGTLASIFDMYEIEGSYKMYKEGQAILKSMAERYGEESITLLLENWWQSEKFNKLFEITTGESLEQFNSAWIYSLKKYYFPEMKSNDSVSHITQQITKGGMSVKPSVMPVHSDSSKLWEFVFFSNRTGYSDIYKQRVVDNSKDAKRIIKGERTADFESFHLLRSKMDVSRDSLLVFVSKSNERDVIYVWDLKNSFIVQKLSFQDLISLSSPAWSPDGEKIAFSGITKEGMTDLYIFDLRQERLTRLTNDIYDDQDPDWSPDGNKIVFSSDRTEFGSGGFYNLFIYDLTQKYIRYLTQGQFKDTTPVWSPDGVYVAFSSDRDGPVNLYIIDENNKVIKITNITTGAFDPAWLPDSKGLLFSGFEDYSYQIYRIDLPKDFSSSVFYKQIVDRSQPLWFPKRIAEKYSKSSIRYRKKFSLDIAQSQFGYDPELGSSGGLLLALTDVLGDYHYYFLLTNTAENRDELLKSFNIAITALNLTRQANIGWGAFHLAGRYFNSYDGYFYERRIGGLLDLTYPFSKFNRLEVSLVVRDSEKEWFYSDQAKRRAFLISNFVGYTSDTSLWEAVGPIDGYRYNFTLGHTVDARRSDVQYTTLLADYRHYFRLSQRTSYALRLVGRSSYGKEAERFYMGGSWTLRGYSYNSIWGRNLLLWNNELRFPLIDNLLVGFPFGRIGFNAIRGALFVDLGNAWENHFEKPLGSYGIGIRLRVADFLVLRFDIAKRFDFKRLGLTKKTHTEFLFGWNY